MQFYWVIILGPMSPNRLINSCVNSYCVCLLLLNSPEPSRLLSIDRLDKYLLIGSWVQKQHVQVGLSVPQCPPRQLAGPR